LDVSFIRERDKCIRRVERDGTRLIEREGWTIGLADWVVGSLRMAAILIKIY